jgi:hypothetical protein
VHEKERRSGPWDILKYVEVNERCGKDYKVESGANPFTIIVRCGLSLLNNNNIFIFGSIPR